MKRKLILIFTILTFISCGNENDDIYKTKSGEFASKSGNFIAAFPIKPGYTAIDNQIGLDKFQIHMFRTSLGTNKVFSIEYNDYPEYMIKSMTDEQIYSQGVTNFANKMADSFRLEFQEPIEQNGLNGVHFVFGLKKHLVDKGVKGYIAGKLFRNGNRVYTVSYIGENDKHTDSFMESFRLIK
ncbi:hypothetical protein CJ739_2538 [Mariniflexile rhizosphaerae]|uniref:hypothetical protein n=1 Tax=unclassified Mariniflexile TaxID=2643887 RepID=UPI000CBC1A5F|nr:hypothetical protein [Mariniflexile sp. TRM1-10]AXP81611.1 hypothetical protein CJ739_2538 [Mariniflexile sp. TRM1-10]PLB17607.1 MAG: hypothetical protein TRG1_3544 [Flavobacteriaceae bacterium FS1-H7996/R]